MIRNKRKIYEENGKVTTYEKTFKIVGDSYEFSWIA